MNIGFIGAGKVGFSLGKYFSMKNKKVEGYYSRNYESSVEAAKFTNSKAYRNLEELVIKNDIIFITTPDDTIKDIWEDIKKFQIEGKIICHTSGSLSSDIFSDIDSLGAFQYSIHPMFPFSDKYETYKKLNNIHFTIEGHDKHLSHMKQFLESLGNKTLSIGNDKKSLYHLGNVTVSNLVIALIESGCNYLEECGINKSVALEAMYPLIKSNIENIGERGITSSLTGPIERGDIETIKKHMEAIPCENKKLYKNLSLKLLGIAKNKNKNRDYSKLQEYLEEI
ncbi:Rossmann-like and DUF2520 domain-containing protein [Fusobacterium sp. MFO224]|uniref:Rossmann-like and DUF2520 domain-containing protein n=1 Tax=Fusobacterium sp. MFO224 TaxID=3378070 RepID=UPI003854C2B1